MIDKPAPSVDYEANAQQWSEVDVICDRFEARLKNGESPHIETYLAESTIRDRDTLFRELLALEQDYSSRRGKPFVASEYLERFPEFAEVVHRLSDAEQATVYRQAEADTLTPPPSGAQVGQFVIRGELGRGASSTVYRAHDPRLHRDVAIKIAHTGPVDDRRLEREARHASQLSHPVIVPIYAVDDHSDGVHIVMEFMPGGTLSSRLRDDLTLPADQAVALILRLAEGLAYAHQRGIVHRDLKPSNIMLANASAQDVSDWGPKICDFGLSRQSQSCQPESLGGIVGTPGYMSPEQASGSSADADQQSDLYSLGMILYRLLSGRTAFAGDTFEVIRKTATEDPPDVRSICAGIPKDLAAICDKAVARSRFARYPHVTAFADDLRRWQAGQPIQARPSSLTYRWAKRATAKARKHLRVLVSLALATVLISAVTMYRASRDYQRKAAQSQIERLLNTKQDVSSAISAIRQSMTSTLQGEITDRLKQSQTGTRDRLLLSTCLLGTQAQMTDECIAELLHADAQDFNATVSFLGDNSRAVELLQEQLVPGHAYVRTCCALTQLGHTFDVDSVHLVDALMHESPQSLAALADSLLPCAEQLKPALRERFRDEVELAESKASLLAAAVYDPEELANWVPDASDQQLAPLLAKLRRTPTDAKFALRSALHALPTGDAEDDVVARAHLLLALLSFDELPEDVWQYGPDARLETYLVHKSKQRMVTAAQVAQALFKATTPDAQYGLLLMLGTYNRHELLQSWHPKLTEWCLHEYKANPDSGVHSAIHWLYTRWDMMGALHPLDEHLVNAGYSDGRDWYHDALNHIMVVVRGPRESVQFSQPLMRQYTSEPLARTVRLEHTFAISACEITYRDTASVGFEIERPQELAPSDDCPISTVSFYQAAQLCQLLSALESLPLAFELDDAVAADRKFMFGVRGDIDSAGYRLPTDEEWECVVRGDTTTLRFFGGPETPYLNWYAWYDRDAASTTPVGHHMPNRLGLFDVYGNVFEWTMTTERRGTEPPQPFIDENTLMLLRGSSWPQESVDIHSSIRVGTVAGAARPDVGMRVCRTLNVETFNSD